MKQERRLLSLTLSENQTWWKRKESRPRESIHGSHTWMYTRTNQGGPVVKADLDDSRLRAMTRRRRPFSRFESGKNLVASKSNRKQKSYLAQRFKTQPSLLGDSNGWRMLFVNRRGHLPCIPIHYTKPCKNMQVPGKNQHSPPYPHVPNHYASIVCHWLTTNAGDWNSKEDKG